MNNPKPDDRRDNASKIKRAMAATKGQMEAAEDMIAETDNPKMKEDLKAKNEQRAQALRGMEVEMKQEAEFNREEN